MTAPNPIAFEIFGIEVRWYGVLMAIAVLFGMLVACKRAKKYDISVDRILDFVLIAVPLAFVGARIYYIIFNYDDYNRALQSLEVRYMEFFGYGGALCCHRAGNRTLGKFL